MTIRLSARIAGLAILAAEATALATRPDRPPAPAWAVLVAVQAVLVVWATGRRSAPVLRTAAPALLTAVAVAAVWSALALAFPAVATGDVAALAAVVVAGLVTAASSRPGAGRRLPLGLTAAAGTALLIFLVISWVLPAFPGFIQHNHPPVYTDVTRMVDPVLEVAVFVLLALALGVDLLRARIRGHRVTAKNQRPAYVAGPNEMVVERTG